MNENRIFLTCRCSIEYAIFLQVVECDGIFVDFSNHFQEFFSVLSAGLDPDFG